MRRCVCRDEYKAQQDWTYRRALFESPRFVDEGVLLRVVEKYDCSELEATYTAAGAAAVREDCADTCASPAEYGEALTSSRWVR